MLIVRELDTELVALTRAGSIRGPMHIGIGQEAVGIGATAALLPGDITTTTHRPHAEYVGLGLPLGPMVAEFMGRATGPCGGYAGHMLLADRTRGLLGATGIVGQSLLLAVGHGYAQKLARSGVTLCSTGDGAVNSGAFNEALNMIALWSLPVVVLVQNNQYGLTVRLDRHVRERRLSLRAVGYGIPGTSIDGNDVEVVHGSVRSAVERARQGGGPTLIEAVTYRKTGFSTSDIGGYTDEHESDGFADPLELAESRLRSLGTSDDMLGRVREEAVTAVASAVQFGLASPWPDGSVLRSAAERWDGPPA